MQDGAAFPTALRWSGALAIVLALHATAAWLLLSHAIPPMIMPAASDAVMLDLATDLPPVQPAVLSSPSAPAVPAPPPPPIPVPEPPAPVPPLPETPPEPAPPELPPPELPPVKLLPTPQVQAEAVLPIPPPPPPRPQPKPKPHPIQRQPAAPVADEAHRPIQPLAPVPVQAAPAQPSARPPAPMSTVTPSWRSDLLARLQRAKRYPDLARSHGDQGAATVTFTMDRGGRVLGVTLVRSSGSPLLDDEAVALVHRAEPLPSLPEEMPGGTITLTVPISFALR